MGPYVAVFELILVFGGIMALGVHQLWWLRRDKRRREAAKREAAEKAVDKERADV